MTDMTRDRFIELVLKKCGCGGAECNACNDIQMLDKLLADHSKGLGMALRASTESKIALVEDAAKAERWRVALEFVRRELYGIDGWFETERQRDEKSGNKGALKISGEMCKVVHAMLDECAKALA